MEEKRNRNIEENMQRYIGKEEYTVQEVSAQTYLDVIVKCPYCENLQDIVREESVQECFSRNGEMRGENLEIEISCFECERDFIVNRIYF